MPGTRVTRQRDVVVHLFMPGLGNGGSLLAEGTAESIRLYVAGAVAQGFDDAEVAEDLRETFPSFAQRLEIERLTVGNAVHVEIWFFAVQAAVVEADPA